MTLDTQKSDTDFMAAACESHLESEAILVGEVHHAVQGLRQSLLARDQQQPDHLVERMATLTSKIERVQHARQGIRNRLADYLDVPLDEATVGRFSELCDTTTRSRLEELRQGLLNQSRELHGKLAATGSLAMQLMELNESVFRSLTGQSAQSTMYERNGRTRLPRHAA